MEEVKKKSMKAKSATPSPYINKAVPAVVEFREF
jgi:hypothetical protein